MIRYSNYLTFMCCVNMWGKIQVFCGNSGWPASYLTFMPICEGRYKFIVATAGDPPIITYSTISHLCGVSTCKGRYKCIVATAGDPPMITYSSYLTFMCCVNMWGKIQVYWGNSGWHADDNIQQLSHIYVLCQHVRKNTSVLWQQRWPADEKIQQLSHIYVLCQHVREDTSLLWQQRVTRWW